MLDGRVFVHIMFHGAFPDKYELRPLVATVRDVVTGELILPQVIEAAKSNPEGGFVEYYFDDPDDDTDSADVPKVGYAREFKTEINVGSRVVPFNFIVGSGSSDVRAVVRTTTPTAVPEGRAGLAYPGIPENEGFHDEAVYLCGLRDNPQDRSNVAVQNMGSEGSITLRITAFSGNPADPGGQVVWEDSLGPGEFHQANQVLKLAPGTTQGYVRIRKAPGTGANPFLAYGVVNDGGAAGQRTGDGAYIPARE